MSLNDVLLFPMFLLALQDTGWAMLLTIATTVLRSYQKFSLSDLDDCILQVEKVVKLPTFYAEDSAASANEVWSRLHSDPLFAVRDLPHPSHLIKKPAIVLHTHDLVPSHAGCSAAVNIVLSTRCFPGSMPDIGLLGV